MYFTCTLYCSLVILALRCRECDFATRVACAALTGPALPGAAVSIFKRVTVALRQSREWSAFPRAEFHTVVFNAVVTGGY